MALTTDLTTAIGRVRFRVRDVGADSRRAAFTDAEVQAAIDAGGSEDRAVAILLDALAVERIRFGNNTEDQSAADVLQRIASGYGGQKYEMPSAHFGTLGTYASDPRRLR